MSERFASMPEILAEYEELERKMADPAIHSDQGKVMPNLVQSSLDIKRGNLLTTISLQPKNLQQPIQILRLNFRRLKSRRHKRPSILKNFFCLAIPMMIAM